MKKWFCLLLGILLLSFSACNKKPTPDDQASPYKFSNAGANITATVDKTAFSKPITCTFDEKTLTVNVPKFTGIPATSVYHQSGYPFSSNGVTLSVATETGAKTFLIDKNGQIANDNYTPNTTGTQTVSPSDIGAEYAAGDDIYAYTDGTTTANGEILYGLKDSTGKVVTTPKYLGHFHFYDGYAVVKKADGTHAAIDTTGKEYGTLPGGSSGGCGTVIVQQGEPGSYTQHLYDIHGNRLGEGYDCISYFYNGLALVEKDKKIGIIDQSGNIILAPTIAFDTLVYPPKNLEYRVVFLHENAFLLPIGGEFAVITIDGNNTQESDQTGDSANTTSGNNIREITDESVVTAGDKKIFNNSQITLSVPADWKCLTASGEDNVAYYFRDTMMGEKCQLYIDVTFTHFYKERTRDEYLESFCFYLEDVVIDSLTKETVQGLPCTKVVHSYVEDNTKFTRVLYDNLIEGPRLYDFVITYPTSESNTYEPVFKSIIDSIQFAKADKT